MGQAASKHHMLKLMEGDGMPNFFSFLRSPVYQRLEKLGSATGIDPAVAAANDITTRIMNEGLEGLLIFFEKKKLPSDQAVVVQIRVFSDYFSASPSRITTPRGFLFLYYLMQELAAALDLLYKCPGTQQLANFSEKAGLIESVAVEKVNNDLGECPICMDRQIDTVLACSHGVCKVCEVEWLIGEGRDTCPICRGKARDDDDWVLTEVDIFSSFDHADINARIRNIRSSILVFLCHLPTWKLCVSALGVESDEDSAFESDAFGNWLREQMKFVEDSE